MSTSNNPFESGDAGLAGTGETGGWGVGRAAADHPVQPTHSGARPNCQPTADEPDVETTARLGGMPTGGAGGFGGQQAGPAFAGHGYSDQSYGDRGRSGPGQGNQTSAEYAQPWGSPYSGTGFVDQSMGHGGSQPPVGGDASTAGRRPRRRGLLAIPAVALVAALGASGLTAALVNGNGSANSAGTVTTRVVQGQTSAPDWSATATAASPSVVSIQVASQQGTAEGSGVVLDRQGHIATNNHVVAAAGAGAALQVTDSQQRVYAATVVGTDPATDLAVIKIDDAPASLTPIAMGDADALTVGQPVMALGNPLGLSETVTTGIISALDRPVITQQQSQQPGMGSDRTSLASQATQSVANAIQTNAAINPGNSGGALVNADGQLIGIPSSIASLGSSSSSSGSESGNIGIGFAIPVNEVKSVTSQLIARGTVEHAWLGVASQDHLATVDGANVRGAQLATVAPGSPAASAGLRPSDVIVGIDKDPINGADALMAQIRDRQVGDKVILRVARDGRVEEVAVTLGTAPQ